MVVERWLPGQVILYKHAFREAAIDPLLGVYHVDQFVHSHREVQ